MWSSVGLVGVRLLCSRCPIVSLQVSGQVPLAFGLEHAERVAVMVIRVCLTNGSGWMPTEELMELYLGSRPSFPENQTSQLINSL